jgi:hypothetical protein
VPSKSPVKVHPEIPDIFGELHFVYMVPGGGGHFPLRVVNVTWTDLDPLAFILHLLKPVLDCNQVVLQFL